MRADIQRAIELMRSNDPKSLDRALALLQQTVYAFSLKVCGQREDAEDTMQEVLLKSANQLPKFDSPQALSVWLYKVARSRCLMGRRRSKFAPRPDLSLEALMPGQAGLAALAGPPAATPESSLLQREKAQGLRQAVQQLPPEYRLILVLHDMEDLSSADIAEITGLRPGTIRVRLHRARLYVRKALAQSEVGAPRLKAKPAAAAPARAAPPAPGGRRCKALFAELSAYLDAELDPSLCDELEKHLAGCAPCQAFVASLEGAIRQCRAMPSDRPNPERAARVRREVIKRYRGVMAGAVGGAFAAKVESALP